MLGKNLETNELIVGQGTGHPWLFTLRLNTSDVNWVTAAPALPFRCMAKTRYRQPDQHCTVVLRDAGGYEVILMSRNGPLHRVSRWCFTMAMSASAAA